jgi:hypothetical protein
VPLLSSPAPPPPEKPRRWDEQWREHPVAGVVVVVLGAMAAVSIVRAFFTEGLPWLLSFVDPVSQALRPFLAFVSDNADVLAVGVVTGVSAAVVARLVAATRRREGAWRAERETVIAEREAEHALVEAVLESQRQRLFDLEKQLARAQGRVTQVGQRPADEPAEVSLRDLPPALQAQFLAAKRDASVPEANVAPAPNDDVVE